MFGSHCINIFINHKNKHIKYCILKRYATKQYHTYLNNITRYTNGTNGTNGTRFYYNIVYYFYYLNTCDTVL